MLSTAPNEARLGSASAWPYADLFFTDADRSR
jgi:hypothetical protein